MGASTHASSTGKLLTQDACHLLHWLTHLHHHVSFHRHRVLSTTALILENKKALGQGTKETDDAISGAEKANSKAAMDGAAALTQLLYARTSIRGTHKDGVKEAECLKHRLQALPSMEETIDKVKEVVKNDTTTYTEVLKAVNLLPGTMKTLESSYTVVSAALKTVNAAIAAKRVVAGNTTRAAAPSQPVEENVTFAAEIAKMSDKEYEAEFNMETETTETTEPAKTKSGATSTTLVMATVIPCVVILAGVGAFMLLRRKKEEKVLAQL
ncbi:hypothetical protein ERJ75_000112000 [Trypanosoma vivax]|nr:hypothetical protein TRVL_09173 [Trypanosoma vivax]KAH8610817.1 hypothetical protein ERJ75_001065200 [Trypanosoma vivax]KAH8619963.1 hypothetical protein ERJ75_000112000 [Trypanosoma vivax]